MSSLPGRMIWAYIMVRLMDEGVHKQIWMEEERSLGLKMDLIQANDLAGVACWKLGFEPADIWGRDSV